MKNFALLISCSLFFLFVVSCSQQKETIPDKYIDPVFALYDSTLKPFYHGVASGDPLPDRVILWTRVTPEKLMPSIHVKWEIAEDPNFTSIYKSDTLSTNPQRDYTVKVDVDALLPDHTYYYRFNALGVNSITGRTKTSPVEAKDRLKFAVVSCSSWEWGYFNAYDKIADKDSLEAVIHLGDYIYEYAVGKYGDTTIGRFNLPAHETVTLQDYRTRYSQYHTDIGTRHVHQKHPFIAIWDDHEVANNSYTKGAKNHQPEEGDYEARKAAAKQAYYEWIPIRENRLLYRAFSFGPLADLFMLDERLAGRTKPVDSIGDPSYNNDERSMLGSEQLSWFENELSASRAKWKLVGNQVIFSDIDLSKVLPNMPRDLDSWDGYPAEKKRVKDYILNKYIRNIVFLTGDTHGSWAIEVATDVANTYDPITSKGAFAVEFGTPSISAANSDERRPVDVVKESDKTILIDNPHIKYANNINHGYILITLTNEAIKSEWYYVETLRRAGGGEVNAKTVTVKQGTTKIQ